MAQLIPRIFVDTSAFVAFIDRADLNHRKGVEVFEHLGSSGYQVFTSSHVVLNTYMRLDREVSPIVANDFLQAILESSIEILFPTKFDLVSALRFSRSNPNKSVSINDIMKCLMMEKRGIKHVFTFDFWHNLLGINVTPLLQGLSEIN